MFRYNMCILTCPEVAIVTVYFYHSFWMWPHHSTQSLLESVHLLNIVPCTIQSGSSSVIAILECNFSIYNDSIYSVQTILIYQPHDSLAAEIFWTSLVSFQSFFLFYGACECSWVSGTLFANIMNSFIGFKLISYASDGKMPWWIF